MKCIYLITLCFLFTGLINELTAQGDTEKIDSVLWKKAMRIHHQAWVVDAHAHQLVFSEEDKEKYYPNARQLDIKMIEKGKIDGVGLYFAYYPLKDQTLFERVKADIKTFHKRVKSYLVDYRLISDIPSIEIGISNKELLIIH